MTGKPRKNPSVIPPTFGPWAQKLLDQQGWTKIKAAEMAGIHQDTLRRLFKGGPMNVEISVFEGLAKALNMDLGFVLHKAGFEIDPDGVKMERVQRVQSVADTYGEVESICRSALAECAALLGEETPLDPINVSNAVIEVHGALLALDLAVSRLRAEGYIASTPGAVRDTNRSLMEGARSEWTADQDRMLIAGLHDDTELSRRIGRSVNAIRNRRKRLQDTAADNARREAARQEIRHDYRNEGRTDDV
jgi:transcriptional regulator with XRE-family HTH domain